MSANTYYDYDVALSMVASNLGVALLPALAVAAMSALPAGVHVTAVPGLERRAIVARYRKSRSEPRPVVVQVVNELVRAAAGMPSSYATAEG